MAEARHLCSRCGSPRHVVVGSRRDRCAECGLESTSTVLRVGGAPAPPGALRAATEEVRRSPREALERFAHATFTAHALDERWTGLRWLGGQSVSNGRVTSLTLGHGDTPRDPVATQVRVETRIVDSSGFEGVDLPPSEIQALRVRQAACHLAQEQVELLWHHTGRLSETVRRAAFAGPAEDVAPTAPWDEREIHVDGTAVGFRMLEVDDLWIGHARHGDVFLGVEARGWPPDRTGLVTAHDLAPYDQGTRTMFQDDGRDQPRHV